MRVGIQTLGSCCNVQPYLALARELMRRGMRQRARVRPAIRAEYGVRIAAGRIERSVEIGRR
jgi:hypothetical protein